MECRLVWHEQFQTPFAEVLGDFLQTLPDLCASCSNFLSLLPLYCSAYAWLASLASARFKLRPMLLHSTLIVLAQHVSFQQQPILLCGSAARGENMEARQRRSPPLVVSGVQSSLQRLYVLPACIAVSCRRSAHVWSLCLIQLIPNIFEVLVQLSVIAHEPDSCPCMAQAVAEEHCLVSLSKLWALISSRSGNRLHMVVRRSVVGKIAVVANATVCLHQSGAFCKIVASPPISKNCACSSCDSFHKLRSRETVRR